MAASVKEIFDLLDGLMPFASQEPWDNAGLLAGHPGHAVERVLVALDVTPGAVREAAAKGCQLIVSHHPILFHARKTLREDDPEGALLCQLVRANLSLIAAHTNFDGAVGGVSDALAEAVGLSAVEVLEGGLRIGCWSGALDGLCAAAGRRLQGVIRRYGPPEQPIARVAVCGGAGGSLWRVAHAAGADAYLTGEIHHNDALDATAWGMALIEAGHYATEYPAIKVMQTALQNALDAVQSNVTVFESDYVPF